MSTSSCNILRGTYEAEVPTPCHVEIQGGLPLNEFNGVSRRFHLPAFQEIETGEIRSFF